MRARAPNAHFRSRAVFTPKRQACGLTVCVTGAGAGVDNVWEQEKLEARKTLVNRTESPASSARGVGQIVARELSFCVVNRFYNKSVFGKDRVNLRFKRLNSLNKA